MNIFCKLLIIACRNVLDSSKSLFWSVSATSWYSFRLVWCIVLQYFAVCVVVFCSVLQCVAACATRFNYRSIYRSLLILISFSVSRSSSFVLLYVYLASLKGRKLWLWVAITAPSHMPFHATVTPPFLRPRKIEFVVCKWFVDFVRFSLVTHWVPPTDYVTFHQDKHSDVTSLGWTVIMACRCLWFKVCCHVLPGADKLCLLCGWRPGAGCLFNHGCICIFKYIYGYMVWAKTLLLAIRSG